MAKSKLERIANEYAESMFPTPDQRVAAYLGYLAGASEVEKTNKNPPDWIDVWLGVLVGVVFMAAFCVKFLGQGS